MQDLILNINLKSLQIIYKLCTFYLNTSKKDNFYYYDTARRN